MIPEEHQLKCGGCGKILDMRNLGQVLSHGWIENGESVCYEEEIDIEYAGCAKIGSPLYYPKGENKPINLN